LRLTELRQDELTPRQGLPIRRYKMDGRNEPAQTRSLRQVYSTNSVSRERHHNDEHLREVTANGMAQVEQLLAAAAGQAVQ